LQLHCGLASYQFDDEAVACVAKAGNVGLLERQRAAALTNQITQIDG
jgi:hypothetical protein